MRLSMALKDALCRVSSRFLIDINCNHFGAFFAEQFRCGTSDATSRSCDDGYLILDSQWNLLVIASREYPNLSGRSREAKMQCNSPFLKSAVAL
jgi:hypothetical protein